MDEDMDMSVDTSDIDTSDIDTSDTDIADIPDDIPEDDYSDEDYSDDYSDDSTDEFAEDVYEDEAEDYSDDVDFVFMRSDSFKASLIVQVIIAGIYAVMLISNLIANEYTTDSVKQHECEVAYIKKTASKVKSLIDKTSDKKLIKKSRKYTTGYT